MNIWVTGSKVEQQVFKLTPANPVSIAWGETYQALQQGAADALNVGLGPLTATKIFEFQKAGQAKANDAMVEQWQARGIQVHVLSADEKKVWMDTVGLGFVQGALRGGALRAVGVDDCIGASSDSDLQGRAGSPTRIRGRQARGCDRDAPPGVREMQCDLEHVAAVRGAASLAIPARPAGVRGAPRREGRCR